MWPSTADAASAHSTGRRCGTPDVDRQVEQRVGDHLGHMPFGEQSTDRDQAIQPSMTAAMMSK
jgi:hypothetical protein